jgi:5-methylcytosine-specific restriction endonuclease McrA
MNAAVLVLDVSMRPLRVENWQRAICDLFLGKVEVVEWKYHSQDRTIQSTSGLWPMPSVVRVLSQFRRDRIRVKFSRLNIYTRDDFNCQFCARRFESEDLTFDHVIPRSRGGRTVWENIVTACVPCNKQKSDRLPAEVKECRNFVFGSEATAAQFVSDIEQDSAVLSVLTIKNKAVAMFDRNYPDTQVVTKATELGVQAVRLGMELLRKPRKPSYLPAMSVKMDTRRVPEEWRPYWTTALETE